MEELKISRASFFEGSPSADVKVRVMNFVLNYNTKSKKNNLIKNRKLAFASAWMLSFFVLMFGWYFIYQNTNPSLDKQITQTQSAITELIAMNDAEIL